MEQTDARSKLRASLDSNDSFLSGGHRVMQTAGATSHAARMSRVPVWALDDKKIAEYISIRFPKTTTDPNQRRLAARMALLIHLYYRAGYTAAQTAEALKTSVVMTKWLIHKLEKAMDSPLKPSHRPKKGLSLQTTIEAQVSARREI